MNKLDKYKVRIESSNEDTLEFVSALITNSQGNVLILKRRNDLKLDPDKYDLCSGHIKQGENPIFSMLRELEEELNLKLEKINSITEVGTISTPHKKFLDTKCHIYHVMINISEEQINEMIKDVPEPEIKEAIFLEDLDVLRDLQKNSNLCRMEYTEELNEMYKKVELELEKAKTKEEKCEEK